MKPHAKPAKPKASTAREGWTYRSARRNAAKASRSVWRALPRQTTANGEVRVMTPPPWR
jgi:hypothetical protein